MYRRKCHTWLKPEQEMQIPFSNNRCIQPFQWVLDEDYHTLQHPPIWWMWMLISWPLHFSSAAQFLIQILLVWAVNVTVYTNKIQQKFLDGPVCKGYFSCELLQLSRDDVNFSENLVSGQTCFVECSHSDCKPIKYGQIRLRNLKSC